MITKPQCPGRHTNEQWHFINAVEVARLIEVLADQACADMLDLCGIGKREIYTKSGGLNAFRRKIMGRTGIVFISDYWMRPGSKYADGDHIDLWDGRQTKNDVGEGSSSENEASEEKAEKVYFWPVS
jgi:hypothetical protein